jgi:type IV secretory pathway VirB4 component
VGTRTSQPAATTSELEQAERTIDNRRQQLLYAIGRMNGAKAVAETLAKRRLFFSSLPGMADADKRDQDLLTSNAADLVPVEMPWRGTPRSPLFLLETPYRQLIPFSLFDPGLSDANMLVMAKSGGGKTFMVQQFLLMAARDNPLISIIERGDSYRPLVELMGGRMITMSLDADETLNPWDLAENEKEPSKDQVAFLKNLTRHMLGEGRAEDTELLDNLITEAILRTYKRAAIRPSRICAMNWRSGATRTRTSASWMRRISRPSSCAVGPAKRASMRSSLTGRRRSRSIIPGSFSTWNS